MRSRPAAPSSSLPEITSDHRGPGDTRTLTKKSAGASDPVATLSASGGGSSGVARSRHRPVPGSGRRDEFATVGDRTGAGTRPRRKQRPRAAAAEPGAETNEGEEGWWGERTQRPSSSQGLASPTAVLSRATDTTHRNSTRTPIPEVEEAVPLLKSLVSEGEERSRFQRRERDGEGTGRRAQLAGALGPSFMRSLLQDVEGRPPAAPSVTGDDHDGEDAPDSTAPPGEPPLSSLVESGRHVLRPPARTSSADAPDSPRVGWWGELPPRPAGYVRHAQTLRTTYEDRNEARRDWGDVVTSSSDEYFGRAAGGERSRGEGDEEEDRR